MSEQLREAWTGPAKAHQALAWLVSICPEKGRTRKPTCPSEQG